MCLQFEASGLVVRVFVCVCVCVFVRLFVCLFGCVLIRVSLCFLGWLVGWLLVSICACVFLALFGTFLALLTLLGTVLCFSCTWGGPRDPL